MRSEIRVLLLLAMVGGHFRVSGQTTYLVNTVAGYVDDWGDGGPALQERFSSITAITTDAAGNVYLADNGRVHKIGLDGAARTIVGTGVAGFAGDGGPAIFAQTFPFDLAVAGGVLYISEPKSPRIRKVGADGNIVTVAVLRSDSYLAVSASGDLLVSQAGDISKLNADGSFTNLASLSGAAGLAADGNGNLFVAVPFPGQVWKIDAHGNQTLVAGGGTNKQDGVPALQASLQNATRVALDPSGNLYIAEAISYGLQPALRKIDTNGIVTTVGASGAPGAPFCCLVATDTSGALYTVPEFEQNQVWRVAGTAQLFAGGSGIGDGGPADRAYLSTNIGLAMDGSGNIFVADSGNNRVRKIDPVRTITTVVGVGMAGFGGDGGHAAQALLKGPQGVIFDANGNLFIADTGNNRVRKVDRTGTITTVAGNGAAGFTGDGGAAVLAQMNAPTRMAFSPSGELYIVDQGNSRVRMVSASGTITTVAGNGVNHGCCILYPPMGDGGPATGAVLETPGGIAFDAAGNLYIPEIFGDRIRKVTPGGIISTLTSNVVVPKALAVDEKGNLYIAEFASISKLTSARQKTVLAGSEEYYGNYAFGVAGPDALYGLMSDLVLEINGNLLTSDSPVTSTGYVRETLAANIFPLSVYNAASGQSTFLSPGEIVSIYWADFGPQTPYTGAPGSDGRYATTLAGTQVLFDGIAAPVLSVDAQQVTAIVPYALAGMYGVNVQVVYQGKVSNTIAMPMAPASPGLYGVAGHLTALNADGRANSPANPAARGSAVVLFATGAGVMSPAVADGTVSQNLSAPVAPVSVQIGGLNAQVLYAGSSAGAVAGVLQLNVVVPSNLAAVGSVPVVLTMEGASSQAGATISVR